MVSVIYSICHLEMTRVELGRVFQSPIKANPRLKDKRDFRRAR